MKKNQPEYTEFQALLRKITLELMDFIREEKEQLSDHECALHSIKRCSDTIATVASSLVETFFGTAKADEFILDVVIPLLEKGAGSREEIPVD